MKSDRWLRLLVTLVALSVAALAQDTGQITGSVKDPSGASVANAQVVVASPERGINRVTNTNGDGDYLVGGLPGGTYNLSITAPGFRNYSAKGVVLRVGAKNRADATLQVGAASTEITVEGQNVAQVETQSSDLAGTITGKQISQLQLNGRNFTQLATLVPGVSNQTGQDEGTVGVYGNVVFSFNGGRGVYNNWELDGGDNMDNGSNATLNVYPSIDAIAEVRVLTSNYGAQYGRNGSGTVETEIKSGTSGFHGAVYEFVRNEAFNARNYFQSKVPTYKKNDYGYNVGGPIFIPGIYNTKKDKSFFFWSQEWRKDRVPGQNFNVQVPTAAERAGDFRDLCPGTDCPLIDPTAGTRFPGDQVPVAPAAVAFLQQIPLPTQGRTFQASPVQPTNWREELLRVDHNFGSKMRASFHYIHDSWDTVTAVPLWTNAGDFPTVGTTFGGPGVSLVTRLTANASPTLLNEFVFSYTTDHILLNSFGAWKRPAVLDQPGVMGALFNNGFGGKAPGFQLTGGSVYGGGFGEDPGYIPNGLYNSNPSYTLRDNVTKIIGRHNLIFGGYAAFRQKNELSVLDDNGFLKFKTSSQVSTGNPFADLLIGRIASYQQGNRNLKYYNRAKTFEPYVQDDWRVTDRLTLNLGLRLSLYGTYRERYKHVFNFDPRAYDLAKAPQIDDGSVTGQPGALIPGTGDPFNGMVQCGVSGAPPGCQEGHLFNPAPRIGFAYDPSGTGKTAIRGGYGVFWEQTNGNEANTESLSGSPPAVLSPTQFNIVGYGNIGGAALLFPLNVTSIATKAVWPYMQQWHLDVQHEVLKNTVATVSYVGSKGTHLGRRIDLNQLPAVPLSLNPYKPGEPIGGVGNSHDDCGTMTTPSGVPVTGQAARNLQVACGADPNPFRKYRGFGDIALLENKSSSIYHGFQTSVRRSVGSLQLNVAYTYAHSIDDTSGRFDGSFVDSFNPAAGRASSNFDQRHMLNIGYVYDLPFFRDPGLAHTLLGGWQWSGITTWQTGTPFTLSNDANYSDNAGVANNLVNQASYPDRAGDPSSNVPNVPLADFGPLLYNPAAFTAPRGLTFGTAGRNVLRNPSRTNFDMSLFKHFAIKESLAFEFRAEAFNIFNHTQWANLGGDDNQAGSPNSTRSFSCYAGGSNSAGDPSCLSQNNFLHVGGAHNPRILQLGAKFIF